MSNQRIAAVVRVVLIAAIVPIVSIGGCARKKAPAPPPPPPLPSATQQAQQRVDALTSQFQQLSELANRLPGENERDHRQVMAQVFGQLAHILPMLAPRTGALSQQLAILQNAQRELTGGSQQMASEPTIDTALRAALNALIDASHSYETAQPIQPMADQLHARLAELDTIRGAMHRLVAGQAARLAMDISGQLVSAYAQQVGAEITLTTRRAALEQAEQAGQTPATMPATEAAGQPRTLPLPGEPTTAPAP